jgi:hypothetical protein
VIGSADLLDDHSFEEYSNCGDVVAAPPLRLLAQALNEHPQPFLSSHSLVLTSHLLVHQSDLLAAECLEETVAAQQQKLEVLLLVRGDVGHGTDHAGQPAVLPELDLSIADGSRDIKVSGQHSHLPEELDLVEAAFLLPVDLAPVLDDAHLLHHFVRLVVPSQLQHTSPAQHQRPTVSQVGHHHLLAHQQAHHCARTAGFAASLGLAELEELLLALLEGLPQGLLGVRVHVLGAGEQDGEVLPEEVSAVGAAVAVEDCEEVVGLLPVGEDGLLLEYAAVPHPAEVSVLVVGASALPRAGHEALWRLFLCEGNAEPSKVGLLPLEGTLRSGGFRLTVALEVGGDVDAAGEVLVVVFGVQSRQDLAGPEGVGLGGVGRLLPEHPGVDGSAGDGEGVQLHPPRIPQIYKIIHLR